MSASVEKGLEMIVRDESHERYSLFDVTTTNSKIAEQLRQEAEEMVFQWCYSVDTSLVALKRTMELLDIGTYNALFSNAL